MSESHDYNALDMSVKGVEDKRAKREIANMNERRRMQNINSGFHSLRALLPHKHDGEKLSKAAILQHTSNYIYQLEQEITKLLSQNSELKRALGGTAMSAVNTNTPEWIKRFASEPPDCPSCKRRKFDDNNRHLDLSPIGPGDGGSSTESSSEQDVTEKSRVRSKQNGSGGGGGKNGAADSEQSLRRQLSRVEKQLEEERRMRRMFEEELGYQNNYQNKSNNNHHNNNNNQLEGRRYSNSNNNNNNNNFNSHNNNSSILDPSSMVSDEVEVTTESIEIEMHSCPASPPDGMALGALPILTEQVSHSAAANAVYLANQHHSTAGISAPALAAAAEMNHHKLLEQQRAAAKQNAIALPIDVPFVAPSEVVTVDTEEKPTILTTNENGTPMIAFIDNNGKMHVLGPATMSQTTSNGVTAIGPQGAPMHMEHLNSSAAGGSITSNGNVPQSTCILKEEKDCCTTSLPASSMQSNVRCSVITTAISAPTMSTPNEGTASFESANSKASRQNLNTIVEAIRHLEGDHLFNESPNKASRSSPTF